MKKVLYTFCCIGIAFSIADEATEKNAYNLAQKYENENKTAEAFFWYKKAAESLEESNLKLRNRLIDIGKNDTIEEENYISDLVREYEDNETKNTVLQMADSLFGVKAYKSNYLIPISYDFISHQNRKHAETLFQLSVKKDLLKNFFGFNEVFGIAYTQRSWWQTIKQSAPFRETNYLPEIYMSLPHMSQKTFLKSYRLGFVHESNGQAKQDSRSWNKLYLDITLQYQGAFINPRVWYRIPERADDDDNKDILDYIGYGDLTIIYPYKNQLFKLLLRNNFDFDANRGAVQLDWTFPFVKSGVFGYVQYFDGYGESLIDYNKKTRRIGIGMALSR
jgi:phospholipase A1